MARGKLPSKRPQAEHKPKSRSSQHDKRKRLDTRNPQRKKTAKAKVPLTGKMAVLVMSITRMLDARMAFRLSIIIAGMMLIVAVDDSTTQRYGRHVEGAGVHHNPTAGPVSPVGTATMDSIASAW